MAQASLPGRRRLCPHSTPAPSKSSLGPLPPALCVPGHPDLGLGTAQGTEAWAQESPPQTWRGPGLTLSQTRDSELRVHWEQEAQCGRWAGHLEPGPAKTLEGALLSSLNSCDPQKPAASGFAHCCCAPGRILSQENQSQLCSAPHPCCSHPLLSFLRPQTGYPARQVISCSSST